MELLYRSIMTIMEYDTKLSSKISLLDCLGTHLIIVFLKSCQILSSFREFSLLHAFSDVPVNKGSLGIHQVEFMIDPWKYLGYGCRVADHTASSHYFGHIPARNGCRRLIVDANLEPCGAPVNKLDGPFCFDVANWPTNIFGDDVSSVG